MTTMNPAGQPALLKKHWITPEVELISVGSGHDPHNNEGYLRSHHWPSGVTMAYAS
jgi:hypothetical protein